MKMHLNTAALILSTGLLASGPAFSAELLTHHVPMAVLEHEAALVGHADPEMHMPLSVALPMRNQDELYKTLAAIYDPHSPQYKHYLTLAEFTQRFGPTQTDYSKTVNFFQSSGLEVKALSANRYIVDIDGPVSAIERVFHIRLNLYRHPTENRSFIAPDREPTLDFNVPVLHVTGLDNFTLPRPRLVGPREPEGGMRATGSGPGGNFIGSDMRAAYYGGSALRGAGQAVGLMEFEGIDKGDIGLYWNTVHQSLHVKIYGVATDGSLPVYCTKCDDSEQLLDIDYAISMAPGLSYLTFYVSANPVSILNAMATDTSILQFSTSWGWGENFATEDPIYKEMATQGQTFLTASGDSPTLSAAGPWPEEDANMTAVGGTDLVTKSAGGAYKSETAWSDSASGPSLDHSIEIEPYQLPFINASNKGSYTLRNVSDVSANANFDMYICATFQVKSVYTRDCQGGWGGTSFASPIWAGFIALANEAAEDDGNRPVGAINPIIYPNSSTSSLYSKMFHDVTHGKSGKYPAVEGYDLATGLGSPNGQGLINVLEAQ